MLFQSNLAMKYSRKGRSSSIGKPLGFCLQTRRLWNRSAIPGNWRIREARFVDANFSSSPSFSEMSAKSFFALATPAYLPDSDLHYVCRFAVD
jgi:hypothetical protein